MPSEKSATKNRTILDARRDPKLDAANSTSPNLARAPFLPTVGFRRFPCPCTLSTRMTELAVARLGTIVRLGEALPVVFFSSAVDFILPVNCRRSTTAVRAASGTAGKMNSSEAEPRHAAPPARAACEGWLWPQQVDQTGVKACRRRAVVARAETAAEEPSAVASQRLPGSQSGSTCPF